METEIKDDVVREEVKNVVRALIRESVLSLINEMAVKDGLNLKQIIRDVIAEEGLTEDWIRQFIQDVKNPYCGQSFMTIGKERV